MIKFEITKEIFESHCSSATNSNSSIFDALKADIPFAESRVVELLGLDSLESLPENIHPLVEKAICLDVYADAIPHLDLVLTSTGFGVVSTSNVVPASVDRVSRLQAKVQAMFEDAIDDALSLLRFVEEWNKSDAAVRLISSIFWQGKQLRKYGYPQAHRSELSFKSSLIYTVEDELRKFVGDEIMDELILSIRTASSSSKQLMLIGLLERVIMAAVSDTTRGDITILRNTVARYLINNLDDFPTFKNSSAYAALKHTRYENTKESPCYFF